MFYKQIFILLIILLELDSAKQNPVTIVEFNLFKYAYMVAIFYENEHVCNGVLFSPTKVLTVSDCLVGYTVDNRSRFEVDATVGIAPRSKAKRYKVRRWKIQDKRRTTFALGSILNFIEDFIASAKFIDNTNTPTECNLLTFSKGGTLKDIVVKFKYCPSRRYYCFSSRIKLNLESMGSPILCQGSVYALNVFQGNVPPYHYVLNIPESLPWIMSDFKSRTNKPRIFHLWIVLLIKIC